MHSFTVLTLSIDAKMRTCLPVELLAPSSFAVLCCCQHQRQGTLDSQSSHSFSQGRETPRIGQMLRMQHTTIVTDWQAKGSNRKAACCFRRQCSNQFIGSLKFMKSIGPGGDGEKRQAKKAQATNEGASEKVTHCACGLLIFSWPKLVKLLWSNAVLRSTEQRMH